MIITLYIIYKKNREWENNNTKKKCWKKEN